MNFSVKRIAFVAIMAAAICVIAPFAVFLPSGVPISLATFAVYLSGIILGKKDGTLAVSVYVMLGAVGLPVYSGFSGGLGKLLGVTGGYIFGYILCAFITGLFADLRPSKVGTVPAGAILGTLACYAVGTAWFMFATGSGLAEAIGLCVAPYLIGDGLKIAAATAVGVVIRKKLMNKVEIK